jgi:Tol biopolymer transport system component
MNVATGKEERLTQSRGDDLWPVPSPDGKQIAFTTASSLPSIDPEFGPLYETSDIWVMDADGSNRVRVTDGRTVNFAPTWSPTGQVLFTSTRSGNENIWSLTPATGISPAPSMPITGTPHQEREESGPPRVLEARSEDFHRDRS